MTDEVIDIKESSLNEEILVEKTVKKTLLYKLNALFNHNAGVVKTSKQLEMNWIKIVFLPLEQKISRNSSRKRSSSSQNNY